MGLTTANYGSGDGYGSGYGNGYGSGDGGGYGNGYGDGAGYGYGGRGGIVSEDFISALLNQNVIPSSNKVVAFWRSNADGTPANHIGCTVARKVGMIEEVPGPLRSECGAGQLHATHHPHEWKGDKLWLVALHGDIRSGDDKMWGLKREIICELPNIFKGAK